MLEKNMGVSPPKLTDSIGIDLPFNNVQSSIKQHLGGNIAGRFLPHCNVLELAIRICCALESDDHRYCIFSHSARN